MTIELFSTCPPSDEDSSCTYLERVIRVSRWSERAGCRSMLIFADNRQADAWMLAQQVMANTREISPLVAVQPLYSHPYTVATKIWTLSRWFQRPVFLNMVAGGFVNDLAALGDQIDHDARYDRLIEFAQIVRALFESNRSVTFHGDYYQVDKLKLPMRLPQELMPRIYVSGSSAAALTAARRTGATVVQYPEPPEVHGRKLAGFETMPKGVRLGIVARDDNEQAWMAARQRFPEERRGRLRHQMARSISDSNWFERLSSGDECQQTYWLHPFRNYQTMCPYLVGDYQTVSIELGKYIDQGHQTFILDVPGCLEELFHARRAFSSTGVMYR